MRRRAFVLKVIAAYVLFRVFSAVVIVIVARSQEPVDFWGTGKHPNYFSMMALWDGFWYGQIANVGYPSSLPIDAVTGAVHENAWAFYPAFPVLTRGLMNLTGLEFTVVGSTLALVLGVGAAVVMGLLLRDRVGPKVALAAVAVWAACPVSPSLQIAYTESLAMLLLCSFLWVISKERWLLTAGLALLIGVTRAMALPLAVVALVSVVLRWRRRHEEPVTPGEGWSILVALASCGAAGLLWPAIVGVSVGSPLAYTDTMGAWSVGGSVKLLRPWLEFVTDPTHGTINAIKVALGLTLIIAMTLGPWAARLGTELRTWTLAYTGYLILVDAPSTSLYRHLLQLFPLIVVAIGGGWKEKPPRWLGWRTGLLILAGLAGQVWWVATLLRFVGPSDVPP